MFNDNEKLVELGSKLDLIQSTLDSLRENVINKVYTTDGLCEYLHVGKDVIQRLRREGLLSYSRIGRTCIYTQKDVDELLSNNRIKYVA